MNASIVGSKDWWTVVRSMPLVEALQHVNDYRAILIEENAGKPSYAAAGAEISRVNAEIKRLNVSIHNSAWMQACREILPADLREAVRTRVVQLENECRATALPAKNGDVE